MVCIVDGQAVTPDALAWPAMNFGQFGGPAPVGEYELRIGRAEFVRGLDAAYRPLADELRADSIAFPDDDPSPLDEADWPPLDAVVDLPDALAKLIGAFLYEDVYATFLPGANSPAARFVMNSVDDVRIVDGTVRVLGRGFYIRTGAAAPAPNDD